MSSRGMNSKLMPGGLGPHAPRRGAPTGGFKTAAPSKPTGPISSGKYSIAKLPPAASGVGGTASQMPGKSTNLPGRSFERYQAKGGNMNQGQFNATGGAGAAAKANSKMRPKKGTRVSS